MVRPRLAGGGVGGLFDFCTNGNFAHNAKYISKDGKLVEIGLRPTGNGKKRRLLEYKKQIEAGEHV